MAEQQDLTTISLFFKDPKVDPMYHPVVRSDQLQAIKQYLTTGIPRQSTQHHTGNGTFDVKFDGMPQFYYTKDGGKGSRVEVIFTTPILARLSNRAMNKFGGTRRSTKRSKKARRTSRGYNK